MRRLALGTLLASLSLLIAACGDSSSDSCTPGTCGGCCNAGQCVFDNPGCGSPGAKCSTWQKCSTGQSCQAGRCVDGTTACSPANCPGCCVGKECKAGTDMAFCGKGGGPCFSCTPGQQTCGPTGCQGSAACGPGTCTGCCSNNACISLTATDANNCGKGGTQCQPCPSGSQCVSGACKSASSCDKTNCSTGCCYNGVCMQGNSSGMCGTGAVACVDCTSKTPSQFCDATTKTCVSASCGPTVCPGCCDSANKCQVGTNTSACGKGGVACQDCSKTSGQVCDKTSQSCQTPPPPPTCSASNCAGGCCDATAGCLNWPNASNKCGTAGGGCTVCASGQECVSGQCKCTPSSCPTGCCQNNQCMPGTTNPACGKGGAVCAVCSGTDVTCNTTTRVCDTSTPPCSASTCGGANCCSNTSPSKCIPGTSNNACGSAGVQCVDCTKSSQVCSSAQKCAAPTTSCSSCESTPGTCCGANGCELSNPSGTCAAGSPRTCGPNGLYSCIDCCTVGTPALLCDQSIWGCVVNPTTRWKVILSTVTLNQTWNFWGAVTDPKPWQPPAVYVEVAAGEYAGSYTYGPKSSSVVKSYSADWGGVMLIDNVPASVLTAPNGFHFHVYNQVDWGFDDDIANCLSSLTTIDLYNDQFGYWTCWNDCQSMTSPETTYFPQAQITEICFGFQPM